MRAAFLLPCIAAAFAAETPAFDIEALQHLLQAGPRPELRFTESRESPWLSAPSLTSGTMVVRPGLLEKRVDGPRRETYRLLSDRLQVESVGRDGLPTTRDLAFADAPALAALAQSLRLVMAGELGTLRQQFDMTLTGEARLWSVRLVPRSTAVSRTLQQIDLQGTYGQLKVLVTQEAKGERTTTRLLEP